MKRIVSALLLILAALQVAAQATGSDTGEPRRPFS